MHPLDKILHVEKITEKEQGFAIGKNTIEKFKVIEKGENCRKTYKQGDVIFALSGQALVSSDFTILHDEDVLGIIENANKQ